MRIASVGHAVFAATFVALGIQGLMPGHFAQILGQLPRDIAGREVLVALIYLRPFAYLTGGLGLLWQRTAAAAARLLFAYLLLWMLAFKIPFIVRAPTVEVYYQSWGETAVLVAGAWVLYAWFAPARDRQRLGFATDETGLRNARILYALALIAFGLSHFAYLGNTARLVPAWLPWHVFWAYFTGSTYLLAAAAILVGVYARLATALSALQMGLFTLLVWTPLMSAGIITAGQRGEFLVSWMLTAAAWVLTDSYRSVPWLAPRKHASAGVAGQRAL